MKKLLIAAVLTLLVASASYADTSSSMLQCIISETLLSQGNTLTDINFSSMIHMSRPELHDFALQVIEFSDEIKSNNPLIIQQIVDQEIIGDHETTRLVLNICLDREGF